MGQPLVIQKNTKSKVIGLIVLAALACSVIWAVVNFLLPALPGLMKFKVAVIASIAGLFCFVFFLIIKQIASRKPALIIDEKGVTDKSSPSGIGFVPWSDIVDIKEAQNGFKQKLIIFQVQNPHEYVNVKGARFRSVRESYLKQFGSPIVISAINLKYDKNLIVETVKKHYQRSRV